MKTLEPILAEHPFFRNFQQKHIDLLVGCASNVRFNAEEFLFRAGEEADKFFIIRKGRVHLEFYSPAKGAVSISTFGDGEILGFSWLIPPYFWKFDGRAVELTRAIALDGKCLRRKCEEDHDFGFEMLKHFSHHLAETLERARLQLLDVYGS
jgi:CRP-like cAMP-binding protein